MSIRIIVRCTVCHCASDIAVGGSYEKGKPFFDPRPLLAKLGWVFDEWGERCDDHAAAPTRCNIEDDGA